MIITPAVIKKDEESLFEDESKCSDSNDEETNS